MKVVVIGHGMVGSRFVEELVDRVEDASITVLGKEDVEPYNRVLLSNVVSGKTDASMLGMGATEHERVAVLQGVWAVAVDRDARVVTDSEGSEHHYDRLVFATGSSARIPAIHGIATEAGLLSQVYVLKDLADAERIVAGMRKAKRAVVLGAGVLGLEVATGLAHRGLNVTIVHHAERLMERQLGSAASAIAQNSLTALGITVHMGAAISRVHERRGTVASVGLEDGTEILTDMLVMCAGTIPEAALARNAGIACDRGILVGHDLATLEDPLVFAIGDCAQPPEGANGLVAKGWEQSSRLVDAWAGAARSVVFDADSAHDFSPASIVRVKAPGMELVTMGLSGKFEHGERELRAVRISDPAIGRFVEVVVSHGLLVGATIVGDKATAALLSAMYTRMLPVPSDPAHLIVRPLAGSSLPPVASAQEMADDDTVCNCNTVTKGSIVAAVHDGCVTPHEVAKATRATTGCGDCTALVGDIIRHCPTIPATPALAGATKG